MHKNVNQLNKQPLMISVMPDVVLNYGCVV